MTTTLPDGSVPRPGGFGPRPVSSSTVRATRPNELVVDCGLVDISLADLPTSVVLFYADRLDPVRLAAGLAVALERLPVFAGRLRNEQGGLRIVCGSTGVPLDCYEVDETLAEAIGRMTLPESGFVDHVQATRARVEDLPLLTVRISRLADGGTALGCSWHHAVGDLHSFLRLLHTWSAAVEDRRLPEAVLVGDRDGYLSRMLPERDSGRPSFRLVDGDERAAITEAVRQAPRANRSVQILFTDAEVGRLRDRLSERAGRALSVNDVVCAHLVSVLAELAGDGAEQRLVLPVDVRRRLGLPDGLIGNLVSEIYLQLPADPSPELVANAIRDAVEDFPRAHLSLRANLDYLAAIGRPRLTDCVPVGFDPGHRTITISNWSRSGVYEVSFGGRTPVCFSAAANLQLAWTSWLVEGFGNSGLLTSVALPARLATRLRAPEGRAAMHRHREPGDPLPPLAGELRKLV